MELNPQHNPSDSEPSGRPGHPTQPEDWPALLAGAGYVGEVWEHDVRLSADVLLDWVGRVDGRVVVVVDGRDLGRELLGQVADVVWAVRRDARLLADWLQVEPGRGLQVLVAVEELRPEPLRRLRQLPVELFAYRWLAATDGRRHAALLAQDQPPEATPSEAPPASEPLPARSEASAGDQPEPHWLAAWGQAVRRIDPELAPRACEGGFEGPLRGACLYELRPRDGGWWVQIRQREWRLSPGAFEAPLEALMEAYLQEGPSTEPLAGVEELPELEVLLAHHLQEPPVYQLPRPNQDMLRAESLPGPGTNPSPLLSQDELDSLHGGA